MRIECKKKHIRKVVTSNLTMCFITGMLKANPISMVIF